MNRADVDRLRANLLAQYRAKLITDQPGLTAEERATLALGFGHGVGWLLRALEASGLQVDEAPPLRVCPACRLSSREDSWRTRIEYPYPGPPRGVIASGRKGHECPHCKTWVAV